MDERETICRLCLKECDNNFTVLDENATEFVGFLLKSNLFVNERALICANCTKSIKDCSNFKSKCLDVEDFILQRINHSLDINDILNHDVCRLCMCSLKMHSIISSDDKAGDAMQEKIMLEKCLPELDLRITEKPVICVPCRESLQHYFGFITNCRNVEEKIKKYCDAAGIDATSLTKLKGVLEFTAEQEFVKLDEIKVEDKFCGDEEHVDEGKCSEERPSILENLLTKKEVQEIKLKEEDTFLEEIDCKIELKYEPLREMESLRFENVDDQEHLNRFEVGTISSQPVVTTRFHSKEQYLVPNFKGNPYLKRLSRRTPKTNEKVSRIYKCNSCSYQTKYSNMLSRHLLEHKDPSEVTMYKCDSCMYQTIHKYDLSRHMVKHQGSSNVTIYKCDSCSFQTKYNSCFHRHLLRHKKRDCLKPNLQADLSAIPPSQMTLVNEKVTATMYQCNSCPYQTKYKSSLNAHLLVHKDPSEVTMFKCTSCLYQSKYKKDLERHLVNHKDPSEVTMHKCDSCSYQTKHKSYLNDHLLRHHYPLGVRTPKVTVHNCDFCSYETKSKSNLKKHLLKHEDPSRVPVFKCDSCSYQSKFKFCLDIHLVKHKDPSEVTMYKCDSCSYQTANKYGLKDHLLKHKDSSEVTLYKCDFCSFQSKYKKSYNKHFRRKHVPTSQMALTNKKATTTIRHHQCDFCDYEATKKCHLRDHLLLHKDPSELEMYNCNFCSYQAIQKAYLKRHLLKHHPEAQL